MNAQMKTISKSKAHILLVTLSLSLAFAAGAAGCGDDSESENAGSNASTPNASTPNATTPNATTGDAGNSDTGETGDAPEVVATAPLDAATGVFLNTSVTATFTEVMDPNTLTAATLTVTAGETAEQVAGEVTYYTGSRVVFWPTENLESNTEFTVTIHSDATSAAGVALAEDYSWTFETGAELITGQPVDLGTAGEFAILAKSGISTVPPSVITGDVAVSPAAATYLTGFTLTADASSEFSTSAQVTGNLYASDYASPTPSRLTTAVSDMEIAFTAAAGRAAGVTELGAGNVSGMTLESGVFNWSSGLLITSDVTLEGDSDDVWIFQIAQDLTVNSGARIVLAGGALPKNIFWQVSGQVEVGTTAHLEGIILSQTAITMATGSTINGRLLAQTAVELDSTTVVEPAE